MELFFLLLLLVLMAGALASGFPVAFSLPGAAIITIGLAGVSGWYFAGDPEAYFAIGGPVEWLRSGVVNLRGLYWVLERDTLIAIPLFIFMGLMLQRSKIAEDLLLAMAQLFGPIPGGLAISTVLVGALLAATTGILGATVVAMGLISLPAMLRNNYSKPMATGTIAASGTLGQIIPPSIVLIILADQLAAAADQAATYRETLYKESTEKLMMPSPFAVSPTSAGELFAGAFVPGLVLVGLYVIYLLVRALMNPASAPAVPGDDADKIDMRFVGRVLIALLPPLILIVGVLGSIIAGIATVNQAGAVGAAGALLMAGYRLYAGLPRTYWPLLLALVSFIWLAFILSRHEVNVLVMTNEVDRQAVAATFLGLGGLSIALIWSGIRVYRIENGLMEVLAETTKSTSLVFIIILGAAILTAAFRAFGGEDIVRELLNGLPGGFWMKFFIVMAVIFLLGFFLEFIEITVVVIPVVAPILLADPSANVSAVWLGVMIGLIAQTSFMTPPFGFALFYMRGVAPPEVKTTDIYKGVVPFVSLQLLALLIVAMLPQLVNYLPQRISLTSENAPPPRNPHLSSCLVEYANEQYLNKGDDISAAIEQARALDLSVLPAKQASMVEKALGQAAESGQLLTAYLEARDRTITESADFRPVQTEVRSIEAAQRLLKTEESRLKEKMRGEDAENPEFMAKLKHMQTEQETLTAQIPDTWPPLYQAHRKNVEQEQKALLAYQRASESGYAPIQDMVKVIQSADALESALAEMKTVAGELVTTDADSQQRIVDRLSELGKHLNAVSGVDGIRKGISNARRAMKKPTPQVEKATKALAKSIAEAEQELVWRKAAESSVLVDLQKYLSSLSDSVGIRSQARISREQGLYAASCNAGHRDISLYF